MLGWTWRQRKCGGGGGGGGSSGGGGGRTQITLAAHRRKSGPSLRILHVQLLKLSLVKGARELPVVMPVTDA